MDVAVRTGAQELWELTDEWRALWERDATASLFHRPEYVAACCGEFGDPVRLHAIEARRDGVLVGLANVVVGARYLAFLGDPEVTDYLGPIAAPGDREAFAQAFAQAIVGIEAWETAELVGLSADTGWAGAIAQAAKEVGLGVEQRQQDVCPRVTIPGGYEEYLASLGGKLRHEIKRKARKLEREAGAYTVRLSTSETLEDDLERFYALHRTSAGPKGHFLHEGMATFFSRLARAFLEKGWLRLSWLEVDGCALAGVFSFAARGTWLVYNSAYDHSARELAPGMVLMAETIRLAAEEGATTFDLLRGDEAYKYRFGAVDVPVLQLTLRR